MKDVVYDISIQAQPTDTTCGPTCLNGIYTFLNKEIPIKETISEVKYLDTGGTMGEALGINALENNLSCTIYTHNLHVFDPTWFRLSKDNLIKKLKKQANAPKTLKIRKSSKLYIDFLKLGGRVKFAPLTPAFLHKLLIEKGPLIVGLSATYLYKCERERNDDNEYDDVFGSPQGHFVILAGMTKNATQVEVYDPLGDNPLSRSNNYRVDTTLFINSILIGAITYDANIVVIEG